MTKNTDQDLYEHHQLLLLAADRAEDALEQAWAEHSRISPISFWKLRAEFNKRKAIAERFEEKHYDRIQRHLGRYRRLQA